MHPGDPGKQIAVVSAKADFDLVVVGHAATSQFSFDRTAREHGEQLTIIRRRPRLRLII